MTSVNKSFFFHTVLDALQKYFGYSSFRPLQGEIISDILKNNNVLVLMPTGGGKSLCYQLPAVMKGGLTVVISPLIALMKDQVDDLQSMNIPAVTINSTLTHEKLLEIKSRLIKKQIKLLYVAPERIMIPDFFDFLKQLNISLIAIDEAHCISEWGHDFRPEYRKLNLLKVHFPTVPVIALTSTATLQVQNDVINQLKIAGAKTYRGSLNRKNLFYRVLPKKDTYEHLLQYVKNRPNDSGIIYCQSRKSVDNLSERLREDGLRALPYHAGLETEIRNANQEKFINDDVEIVVATIAFGMGIDKPNVRYVIHCDMPKSVEGYYQETGRAGRDGLKSDCLLFFSFADKMKHEYFINQIENEQYQRMARKKMWEIINFCRTEKCRRKFLLDYFGEKYESQNCGTCDTCAPSEELTASAPHQKQETSISRSSKTNPPDTSGREEQLFEILRLLRKEIANKEKMPPYIVFPDVTLKEMATRLPQNMESLAKINGVGPIKLKKYGGLFLDRIVDYCAVNSHGRKIIYVKPKTDSIQSSSDLSGKNEISRSPAQEDWTKDEDQRLIEEYDKTIHELSRLLGRNVDEITTRLKKLKII